MTQPTASSKAWMRLRDERNADLARFIRGCGGLVRRKVHSDAFEAGTIAPLGSDELRQEVTAVALVRAVREAIGV